MTLPANLQAALDALDHVTKGPWIHEELGGHLGYPQRIVANDDGLVLVCDLHEGPQHPADNGRHIARYDPDTIRELINLLGEAHQLINELLTDDGQWSAIESERLIDRIEAWSPDHA